MRAFAFGLSACVFALIACHELTGADYVDIGATAVQVARCENEGRACKADGGTDCYGVYERCLKDAGLEGVE